MAGAMQMRLVSVGWTMPAVPRPMRDAYRRGVPLIVALSCALASFFLSSGSRRRHRRGCPAASAIGGDVPGLLHDRASNFSEQVPTVADEPACSSQTPSATAIAHPIDRLRECCGRARGWLASGPEIVRIRLSGDGVPDFLRQVVARKTDKAQLRQPLARARGPAVGTQVLSQWAAT
jgi:hypothetical protein